ncbi:30S ribosomal protein S1 [Flavobacteriaceae bacterium]|nr:30S ribosomal protein S1 [Flavobacteriaceae bacterium]
MSENQQINDTFSSNENFDDLLNDPEQIGQDLKESRVAKGVIIDIGNKEVAIDVGAKSIGYINILEFKKDGAIEKGDVVDVFIEKLENRKGELLISRSDARRCINWGNLKNSLKNKEQIEGLVIGKVKGGYAVDYNEITTFLPRSQVDTKLLTDDSFLINKTEKFMVLKIDELRGNVVVSRRAILESKRAEERDKVLEKINVGDILDGTVKNITDYGAFIDFGSFDGLLHLTDISWCRVKHPSEALEVGQEVKVQVIKYDKDSKRVSIGMKQLQDNPWSSIDKKYPVGTITKGKVTNITTYGAFVSIESGIEGLVHASEMSWTKSNIIPSKTLTQDQEVDVMVLDINIKNHRISLGIKQCSENPWQKFSELHKVGDIVEGVVKNSTEFGTFVVFDGNIDGLIHNSDISWTEQAKEETEKLLKRDKKIKVMVLGSNHEKERIGIGLKQLENKNFDSELKKVIEEGIFSCSVVGVKKDLIEVELDLGLKGIIKKPDLAKDKKDQRTEKFEVGDRIEAKVASFNNVSGKMTLSIKEIETEEQESYIYNSNNNKGETIGSIIGDVLKEKEATEKKKKSTDKAKDAEEENKI